jgi:isopenicillin N synthase-like dioxygenase
MKYARTHSFHHCNRSHNDDYLFTTSRPRPGTARIEQSCRAAAFIEEIRTTAYDLGFFYVTGHGVDQQLIDDTLAVARLFALPEAEKMAIEMVNSPHFRGYNRQGQEFTRGQRDWREQVDIGAEREVMADIPANAPWNRLRQINGQPTYPPSKTPFCATKPPPPIWPSASSKPLQRH